MRIAIIGAGFCGLSVAWHLLKSHSCEVCLFDPRGVGGGASGIATGLLHPYAGEQGRRSACASEGLLATQELIRIAEEKLGKKVSLPPGIIRHVQTEEQSQIFHSHKLRYGDVAVHGPQSFRITSGMTIDCTSYLEGLWRAISERGGKLIFKEIEDLAELRDFDHIVVAAGAGVKKFPELSALRVNLVKGQMLKCRALDSLKLPEASAIGKGYVALSMEEGICHIGSTYERLECDETPRPDKAQSALFPKIASFFPEVNALEVLECKAALRVVRVGHYFPIAERVKDNLWVLTGMGSRGLLYHAYLGALLADSLN